MLTRTSRDHQTIDDVFATPSGKMTVACFCKYAEASHHPLNQFLLRQHLLSAFPGEDMCELTAVLHAASEETDDTDLKRTSKRPVPVDLQLTDLLTVAPWRLHPSLNAHNVRRVSAVLTAMDQITREHRCASTPPGSAGPFSSFAPLLAPLDARPFRLSRLLPAFDWIRTHTGGIVMGAGWTHSDESVQTCWRRWFERYEKLAEDHPALVRYLDPSYVFYEETVAPPPAVTGSVAVIDQQLSVNQNLQPTPVNAGGNAGGQSFRLLDAQGNINVAREIASAYRSHLSVPGGPGGGPGPAVRIASFSSVNMAWW